MIRRLLPILGITFVDILGFSMLIPILPYFVTHFGASPFVVGLLFSTFSLCQLVAGPLWSNASDRIGRKKILIISQVGATAGWAMLGLVTNIYWVFAARVIEGISGGNIGVTQAYVADMVEPKQRSRAFGYIGATFAAGMAIGPLGAGVVFAHYGYSATFFLAAALQFATLLLTLFMLPESHSKADGSNIVGPAEIFKTFRNAKLAPMLWQKLALSLALYGWFSAIALYLKLQMHFTVPQADYFYAGVSVLNMCVNAFLLGRISDRIGERAMSTLGIALLIASFAILPFVHSLYGIAIIAFCFSSGMPLANTGLTALISGASDERRQGTVLGVTSSLDSLSGIVAPPVSTALLDKLGSPWSGAESFLFALIAFVMGLRQTKRGTDEVRTAPSMTAEESP
jgi:DHA1 family tetracycline resistance protein-like MFS transporter